MRNLLIGLLAAAAIIVVYAFFRRRNKYNLPVAGKKAADTKATPKDEVALDAQQRKVGPPAGGIGILAELTEPKYAPKANPKDQWIEIGGNKNIGV